jgi:hypothetical protein
MITFPKYINSLLKIVVGISPSLIILSNFSLPSQAQTNPNPNQPQTKNPTVVQRIQLPTPTDRGTPERTEAGGRRIQFPSSQNRGTPQRTGAGGRRGSSCIPTNNGQQSLTALMPTWDNQGKTVKDNFILYVYVPKTTTKTGEFVVIDDQGNDIYQTNFTPPTQPGIVQMTIPASASLKVGKKYQWYFTLICDPDDRSKDEYVSGLVERTTLGTLLNNSLKQASPLKQAEIYAQKNIWHDTIQNVASVRTEYPEVWRDLLKSVGLEKFAKEPFIDVVTTKP